MAFSSALFTLLLSLVNLLRLVEALPRGRGAGGSVGGSAVTTTYYENAFGAKHHPEYKTSQTFTWYNIPIWGWILIALPIIAIVAICVALAAWKIIAHLTRYDTYESSSQSRSNRHETNHKILCPLCVKKISERSWKSGRHRVKCARKYNVKIQNEWPVFDPPVLCPICTHNLRKMTSNRLFKCSLCPSESVLIGCFLCDFHLCQPCINHQRAQQLIEVVEMNQTTTDLPSSSRGLRSGSGFVPPKTTPMFEYEPSAPSYELVVHHDEDLPTYEEAVAKEKLNSS